jgi:hypothetical protein
MLLLYREYHLKYNPHKNQVLQCKYEISNCSTCLIYSPKCPRDTRVNVILIARLLVSTAAQALVRCELGVFTSRTCVHSRTLLGIETVCWCS